MGILKTLADAAMAGISTAKSGEFYQQGFEAAKSGSGKDRLIIKWKAELRADRDPASVREAKETLIEAYEEGYRDGSERDRTDAIRDQ